MMTLRVCLSQDLPALLDRNPNYLYFTYDKLVLYAGQNTLYENFAIVSQLPEEPVVGMIYIFDTDGSAHRWTNYTDTTIATIENANQLPILRKAGTMFYVNVNRRYVDYQRRVMVLPYEDGTFEMNSTVQRAQQFTNETIMKYNVSKEKFEVYGPTEDELIDWSKEFNGGTTNTVIMQADGPKLVGNVKISQRIHNAIKAASDGLYIYLEDKLDAETYERFANYTMDFINSARTILERVDRELDELEELISKETIDEEIMVLLRDRYSTIDQALANYNNIIDRLDSMENELMDYATVKFSDAEGEVKQLVNDYATWQDLGTFSDTYSQEVDYYALSKAYLNPPLSRSIASTSSLDTTTKVLLQAAITAYLDSENEEES